MAEQPRIPPTQRAQLAASIQRQKIQAQLAKLANRSIQREAAVKNLQAYCKSGFNLAQVRRNFKTLEDLKSKKVRVKEAEKAEEEKVILDIEKTDETATRFQNQNQELNKKTLLLLRHSIKEDDSAEEILRKVLEFYADVTLADDAFEFLIETSSGKLQKEIIKAHDLLHERYEREIKAGRNIKVEAQEFSKKGLGSPTALRDLYRDVTGTSREVNVLFDELGKKFTFDELKTVIKFLFHSLGSDLKSKGPSISRAELLKLVDDTKALQAILGIYRFFESRMSIVNQQFYNYDLSLPGTINFELLAKQFIRLLENRYVSPDKVFLLAKYLGIPEELLAQIIIFTQMRDATRHTSPKLYRSNKHRQEVLDAVMEAIEELEEELEEEEEEENEK